MADEILDKAHDLSDLEIAVLLCLIGKEHCLISTPPDALNDLTEELQLVARKTFGLTSVVVNCDSNTTLDSFSSALLHPSTQQTPYTPSYFTPNSRHRSNLSPTASLTIANIIFARNLHLAPTVVQIQALELLRCKRIYTRTTVQTAPKQFLFIPVIGAENGGLARVGRHLNDFFMIGHWHDPEDGYVNLEEEGDDDAASTDGDMKAAFAGEPLISEEDIDQLAKLSQQVAIDIDITRYYMNIISFLRLHRAVADGISPTATKHLGQLIRYLAPLHRSDFVTPALVGLAVKKIYLHRICITEAEKERSMQWGSRLEAVEAVLAGVEVEDVIEDVLELVTAPL